MLVHYPGPRSHVLLDDCVADFGAPGQNCSGLETFGARDVRTGDLGPVALLAPGSLALDALLD